MALLRTGDGHVGVNDVVLLDGVALRLVLDDVRLLHLDDPHGRHGLLLQPQELDHAPVVVLVDVDDHELELVAVILGEAADRLVVGLVLVGLFAHEEEDVRLDEALEDLLRRLVVELHDERDGVP